MSSECADISSDIVTNHTQDARDGASENILSGSSIQYVLPSHDSLHPSPSIVKCNSSGGNEQVYTWLGIQPYSQSDGALTDDHLASGFKAIMFRNALCTGNGTTANSSCMCAPFAANCSIFPCVKTCHAEIKNFVLNGTELSGTRIPDMGNYYGWWPEKALGGGKWSVCRNISEASSDCPVPFPSLGPDGDGTLAYAQAGCFWTFGAYVAWALLDYFAQYVWLGGLSGSQLYTGPGTATGSAWLQPLFNNRSANVDTVNAYVTRLANSMTAVMRRYGDIPRSMILSGTSYQNQTCVHVQWAWLSLRAPLLVLTAVFLTVTV